MQGLQLPCEFRECTCIETRVVPDAETTGGDLYIGEKPSVLVVTSNRDANEVRVLTANLECNHSVLFASTGELWVTPERKSEPKRDRLDRVRSGRSIFSEHPYSINRTGCPPGRYPGASRLERRSIRRSSGAPSWSAFRECFRSRTRAGCDRHLRMTRSPGTRSGSAQ